MSSSRALLLYALAVGCSFDASGDVPTDTSDGSPIADAAIDPDAAVSDADNLEDVAPGQVVHEDTQAGASEVSNQVSVLVSGGTDSLWLATVVQRPFREADSINGLTGTWTRVASQCSAENATGPDVWVVSGTLPGGTVTAQLGQTATTAVIAVSRYRGGTTAAVATHNLNPACDSGDLESGAYSFPIDPDGSDGIVYVALGHRENLHEPGAGLVERIEHHQGAVPDTAGVAISEVGIAGLGSLTVSGTFDGNEDWGVVAVEIQP